MQNNCAVFRTQDVLEEGRELITKVYNDLPNIGISDRSLIWNTDLIEALELDNMMSQAMVTMAKKQNKGQKAEVVMLEKIFQIEMMKNWMKHTLAWITDDGEVSIDYRRVHERTLTNDVAYIPPKERVY